MELKTYLVSAITEGKETRNVGYGRMRSDKVERFRVQAEAPDAAGLQIHNRHPGKYHRLVVEELKP